MSESATTEHARIQTARSIVNVCLDGVDHDVMKVIVYPTSIVYHLIKHLSLQVYYITDTYVTYQ